MPSLLNLLFLLTLLAQSVIFITAEVTENQKAYSSPRLVYPKVHRVNKTWSFRSAKANGNVTYSDPYVWLEGDSSEADIIQFIKDQNTLTEKYMQGCKGKDAIIKSLKDASSYDQYSRMSFVTSNTGRTPFYLYSFSKSEDEVPTWYIASIAEFQAAKKNNFNSPVGKAFLNESLLSSDGSVSVVLFSISPDGSIFSYLLSSDENKGNWYFRKFDSPLINAKTFPAGGEGRLKDTFQSSIDMISWTPNQKGIFYLNTADSSGGTNTNLGYKVLYHTFASDSKQDITIFDSKNAGEFGSISYYFTHVSEDGRWLIINGYHDASSYNMVSYATFLPGQIISNKMKWISLAPTYDFSLFPGGVIDDYFYFQTNKNAINEIVSKVYLDWKKARQVKNFNELQDRPTVIDVIPERKDASIITYGVFITAKNKILIVYIENGQNTIYLYDGQTGKEIEQLLKNETIIYDEGLGNQNSDRFIISLESWNAPSKIFEFIWQGYRMDTSTIAIRHIGGTKPEDFSILELYATSKDGTKIPYFITNHKDVKSNKQHICWMHMYGSYGVTDNLYYQPSYFDFMRNYDGYLVWAAVRGGGDKGGGWHEAAKGLKKQTTFDDAIAILQDLVKRKFCLPGKIILESESAGRMAVGAVMNQDQNGLIGAAFMSRSICDVFQLELRSTIGAGNIEEFGDVNTPEGFDSVYAYSPLQNINRKRKEYPAVFLLPGSADETVPPSSSFKFAAQLQYDHPNNTLPILLYLVPDAGHSSHTLAESVYQFCIIEQALGIQRKK